MTRRPVRAALFVSLFALAGAVALALPPQAPPKPRLEVETTARGTHRLYAVTAGPDGSPQRSFLRETAAPVRPLAAGRDPAGAASFVTWQEEGSAYRWFALARGAAGWSEPASLPDELALREGFVRPGAALPPPAEGLALPAGGGVFLVQFRTQSIPEWRAALAAAGAEVLAYFPHHAHLVRVEPARAGALAALDFVARVEPFHPHYRLAADVRAWLQTPGPDSETRHVNVLAFGWGAAALDRVAGAAAALGAGVPYLPRNGHLLELTLTRTQLRAVAAFDDVHWIDTFTPLSNDMDLVREDGGANWVETNFNYCGTGVRAEVMDSGIQQNHPDFDGILMHTAADQQDHGTNTYGIIFGNGSRDGDGQAKATGVIPCAQGIFADYNNVSDRFAHNQQLKSAPYFASFQSRSFGSTETQSYTSISSEMDDIAWRLDIAMFQSQANTGTRNSRPQAWAKNVISVGGINHYDSLSTGNDCWCSGAAIGPAEDGRIKPDVSYWYDWIYTTTINNGYTAVFGGTSAATPETAGIAGLIIEMWADNVWGTNPQGSTVFEKQPRLATIKALLINSTQQYPFTGTSSDLTRTHQGWGRPSARVAQERAARSLVNDEEDALQVGQKVTYNVTVEVGEPELRVTMVYTDPPGTTSAAQHRLNDLDLKLTSPSGTVYWGNRGLDAATTSSAGGTRDTKNTVENVFLTNPQPGAWTVEVSAAEINVDQHLATPQADAVFALVVTGAASDCPGPTVNFTAVPSPSRVGESVVFDSTVSGGAGPPYTYEWLLDGDETIDATSADVTYVYRRRWSGQVTLRVTDSAGCLVRARRDHTANGPDLRAAGYVDLVQVDGNGNGAVDPGETWEMRLRLRNDGNEAALGVTTGLAVAPGNPGAVTLLTTGDSPAGDIPVGGTGTTTGAFRFRVESSFPCGNDALFSLVRITSADPVNVYPDEVAAVAVLVGGAGSPAPFLSDGFESNAGWTFLGGGEWQIGPPQGRGAAPTPDPASAAQGTGVLGTDLTGNGLFPGDYEPGINSTATSPAFDCRGKANVSLRFRRWLNVASADTVRVDVTHDGTNWSPVFSTAAGQTESVWSAQQYDVSALASHRPAFQVRFAIVTDVNFTQRSGWNVDALELWGTDRAACVPYAPAGAPGAVSGLTLQRQGANLALAWNADCGAGSAYAIYRGDLALGYGSIAPEPRRCAVAATSATVPAGARAADFFLIVPQAGGSEGSYGNDSAGADRPRASGACLPGGAIDACAP